MNSHQRRKENRTFARWAVAALNRDARGALGHKDTQS